MKQENTVFYNADQGVMLFYGLAELRQRMLDACQHWRSLLSEKELREIRFAQFYIEHFHDQIDKLSDGKRLALIDRLCRILDNREVASRSLDRTSDWACLYNLNV